MIKSPVNPLSKTVLLEDIPTVKIVELYKKLGLDTSRFFQGLNSIEIRKCTTTGYRFYYPFSIFGDEQFYQDLQKKRPAYYHERWEFNKALEHIQKDCKLLEIGSGSGLFLEKCLEKGVKSAVGLDTSTLPEGNIKDFYQLYQKDLSSYREEFPENQFDFICAFQVLEHIWDINTFIKTALKQLKAGGLLVFGVPNNNPYLFKRDKYHTLNLPPHHAGLWDKKALKKMAAHFKLEVTHLEVEPLFDKEYFYQVQRKWIQKKGGPIAGILDKSRMLRKVFRKIILHNQEGRNIFIVLKKTGEKQ